MCTPAYSDLHNKYCGVTFIEFIFLNKDTIEKRQNATLTSILKLDVFKFT